MMIDQWLSGYLAGAQTIVEAVEYEMNENPNMPLKDLLVRIKVAALTRVNEAKDEQQRN